MTTPNQIVPTENDVPGSPAGIGAEITEDFWRNLFGARSIGNGPGINHVHSGLNLSGVDGSLVATFNAGFARIDGLWVDYPSDTIQLVDNAWQYVYLQLDDSGGKCVGAHLQLQANNTVPNNSVLLHGFRVASGAVQDNWDRRPQSANGAHGSASGDDVPAQLVIGFTPTLFFFKHEDGSYTIVASSVGAVRLINNGDATTPSIQSYGIGYKALGAAQTCSWYAIG